MTTYNKYVDQTINKLKHVNVYVLKTHTDPVQALHLHVLCSIDQKWAALSVTDQNTS